MKNNLCNRIVLCGLLSSSAALWAMHTDSDNQVGTPTSPRSPRNNLLQTIEKKAHDLFTHDAKSTSSDTVTALQKPSKKPRAHSTSSTTMPDPNYPAHHHHFHIKKDLEKIEDEVHQVADGALDAVIQHPDDIAKALTPVVGQQTAQNLIPVIESGATKTKEIVDDVDKMIKEQEAKDQPSVQPHTPETLAQKIEDDAKQEVQKIDNLIEGKSEQQPAQNPTIKNAPNASGFTTYQIIIGGTTIVITLAGIIAMLHKYNCLPANFVQFINKLISQKSAA